MNSELERRLGLPPVRPFGLRPWEASYGTEFYGAMHEAARYAGLSYVPHDAVGMWQHGSIPPWQQVQAELCVYTAPRDFQCWVARFDESQYLRNSGYNRVEPIGLPILYTREAPVERLSRSLLIMPMHGIPHDPEARDSDVYINEMLEFREHFSTIVACISGRCMDGGLWSNLFERVGIPVIRGATVNDANSLARIRHLCESFEFVTTNAYGSHVPYALHFGAKVSISGWSEQITQEYLLRDALWALYPDATVAFTSEAARRSAEELLGRFRRSPPEGVSDQELGAWLLGTENKLSPRQLREAFDWNRLLFSRNNVEALVGNYMRWRLRKFFAPKGA